MYGLIVLVNKTNISTQQEDRPFQLLLAYSLIKFICCPVIEFLIEADRRLGHAPTLLT